MIYVFETYTLDTDRRILRCAGSPVRLEPKVFDLLAYLIQHHDRFVSREELHTQLWPEQFVTESALSYCVTAVRKAVGDTGRVQRVIKTVHGRGYRFILPVEQHLPDSSPKEESTPPAPLPAAEPLSPSHTEVLPATSTHQSAPAFPLPPAQSREPTRPGPETFEPERRQLTVLWCRGVAAATGSRPLDPEELHPIIQDAQRVCDAAIQRFEGWRAQHFGDGFVVYFGHPQAHEDDARRAVHTALDIVRGVTRLAQGLKQQSGVDFAVHLGIHTGMVVLSAIGSGDGRIPLALGNTSQTAAHLASLAAPNTVVLSPGTLKLVEGYFVCEALGTYILDNAAEPLVVYQVLRESAAQSRLDVALATRFTPFVGREHEIGWMRERWDQSTGGQGQVVVLQGEAGIGKSRLIREFQGYLADEAYTSLECRCSPYARQSPLYPLIEPLERWLQWQPDDAPALKLHKLEQACAAWHSALEETVPLWAALLSLPLPARYAALELTPRQQKQRTLEVLLAWLLHLAEQQPLCLVVEDLHWADSSTLEFLDLLIDQIPMACLLLLLTCRPDFHPPWTGRSYITHLTLSRLTQTQTERMIERITAGQALPDAVQQQLVVKTNGVPLFVEEMTKMVLELGLDKEKEGDTASIGSPPVLAIPATLQDSLMARLDRQGVGKLVAQLGATLGREFSYSLLQAIAPLDEAALRQGLAQLVRAEILYQRGLPPQAQYIFKHALIQDAAYQSLLGRTRRQYHKQIAQALEERFPETCAAQPELVAHHYTAAGLHAPAVAYWQQAGQRAMERSAYVEALAHLRQGLVLTAMLPESPERLQHELTLSMALGAALMTTQGLGAVEVEHAYIRARECARQVGDPSQIFTAQRGLWLVYLTRCELQMAREQAVQLLHLAQRQQDSILLIEAYRAVGVSLFFLGELTAARAHLEQGLALYTVLQHRELTWRYIEDPGMVCLVYVAWILWLLGYPDQAMEAMRQALAIAHQCRHPFCQAFVLTFAVMLHQCRREHLTTDEQVEVQLTVAAEHGFPLLAALGVIFQGWVLAEHGQPEAGIARLRQGVGAFRATGAELLRPYFLAMLAELYGKSGQADMGLEALAEGLTLVEMTGERLFEAELHRLKGELVLQRARKTPVPDPHTSTCRPSAAEAEACFYRALAVARRQQARALELRSIMSLSRLWRPQGKHDQARRMLEEVYRGFSEGFDTGDLTEARALLHEL